MILDQKVQVSVTMPGQTPRVYVVQDDTGRSITCEITDWTIPDGATAGIWILKDSGEAVYGECTVEENCIIAELTAEMLSAAGLLNAMVEITSDGETVTAFSFEIMAKRKIGSGE